MICTSYCITHEIHASNHSMVFGRYCAISQALQSVETPPPPIDSIQPSEIDCVQTQSPLCIYICRYVYNSCLVAGRPAQAFELFLGLHPGQNS